MSSLDRQLNSAIRHIDPKWDDDHVALLLVRSKDRQRRRRRLVAIAACASVVILATLVVMRLEPHPPTPPVEESSPAMVNLPAPEPEPADPLRFEDGSRATPIDPDTELVMRTVTPRSVTLALLDGAASFDVMPNPQRTFVVDAGQVRIEAIGALFSVERVDDRSTLAVEHGQAHVTWRGGSRTLAAGGRGTFPDGATPRPNVTRPATPPVVKATVSEPAPAPEIIEDVVGELLESADAARLADRPLSAFRDLRTVITAHPDDPRAPAAAFSAARIAQHRLDRPAEAAEMYRIARTLEPTGSLAEDAWLREIEALITAGLYDAALHAAAQYREQHPNGRHTERIDDVVRHLTK